MPTIILNGRAGYIADDLVVGRTDLITRIGRKDLIIELKDEDGNPVEWVKLVALPFEITELLETGQVLDVIDGERQLGIVNPARGIEEDSGAVKYAT